MKGKKCLTGKAGSRDSMGSSMMGPWSNKKTKVKTQNIPMMKMRRGKRGS